MNRGPKFLLTILGAAAVIVPVMLLIFFTSRPQKQPNVTTGPRQIDQNAVEGAASKYPKPIFASPAPASPSAQPVGASGSAR